MRAFIIKSLFLIALLVAAAAHAAAKCPTGELSIAGDVVGLDAGNPARVHITLEFLDGKDPITRIAEVRGGEFHASLSFGTQTRYNPIEGHVCNHRPKSVSVRLVGGDVRVLQEHRLDRHFLKVHEQLNHIRVRLNAAGTQPPEIRKSVQACIPKPIKQKPPALKEVKLRPGDVYRAAPVVKFVITEDGSVSEVRLVRSSGIPAIDEAEVSAVRNWRYRPRPACGEIEVTMTATIHFR